jgi:hypothetical protein
MRGDLMSVVWRNKGDIHILTNIHNPSAEGIFCDAKGNITKPQIVEEYNHHMSYVDKGDRITNSYTIIHHTWKEMNGEIVLPSVRSDYS